MEGLHHSQHHEPTNDREQDYALPDETTASLYNGPAFSKEIVVDGHVIVVHYAVPFRRAG